MAKKALKKKVQAKAPASKLGSNVVDSARDIWLAGLGAFSVAQHESGKLVEQGNKLFDKLVAEGKKLEKSTRNVAENTVGGLRNDVESRVDSVRQQAVDNWDKLEGIFEDRVARVLGRMGVPTADDVNKLSARVQKLSDQVATLAALQTGRHQAGCQESRTVKAATKKAAVKKPAPRKLLLRLLLKLPPRLKHRLPRPLRPLLVPRERFKGRHLPALFYRLPGWALELLVTGLAFGLRRTRCRLRRGVRLCLSRPVRASSRTRPGAFRQDGEKPEARRRRPRSEATAGQPRPQAAGAGSNTAAAGNRNRRPAWMGGKLDLVDREHGSLLHSRAWLAPTGVVRR